MNKTTARGKRRKRPTGLVEQQMRHTEKLYRTVLGTNAATQKILQESVDELTKLNGQLRDDAVDLARQLEGVTKIVDALLSANDTADHFQSIGCVEGARLIRSAVRRLQVEYLRTQVTNQPGGIEYEKARKTSGKQDL